MKLLVKNHHCYNYKYTLYEEAECFGEPEHQDNKHTHSVYSKQTNGRMKVIGHIFNILAKVVYGLIEG